MQDSEDKHFLARLTSLQHLDCAEMRGKKAVRGSDWMQPVEFVDSSILAIVSHLTGLTYLDISASYGTFIPSLPNLQVCSALDAYSKSCLHAFNASACGLQIYPFQNLEPSVSLSCP